MNRRQRRYLKSKGVKLTMNEEQIKQQYQQLCAQAGELQYHITQMEDELSRLNENLKSLNLEYKKIIDSKQQANQTQLAATDGDSNVPEAAKA